MKIGSKSISIFICKKAFFSKKGFGYQPLRLRKSWKSISIFIYKKAFFSEPGAMRFKKSMKHSKLLQVIKKGLWVVCNSFLSPGGGPKFFIVRENPRDPGASNKNEVFFWCKNRGTEGSPLFPRRGKNKRPGLWLLIDWERKRRTMMWPSVTEFWNRMKTSFLFYALG